MPCVLIINSDKNHTASPPLWTPQELPLVLPLDEPAVDPQKILQDCPMDAMLRAMNQTCPQINMKEFELISDRKNLRALFDFVRNKIAKAGHRIDAEVIGGTVLFYQGWSGNGYWNSKSYGMNFERAFTSDLSEGTIQHNRVVTYSLGGFNMMVKYQADGYLGPAKSISMTASDDVLTHSSTIASTGLRVIHRDPALVAAPESILEIKTIRQISRQRRQLLNSKTMAQMWFSQTPILVAGWHDGNGWFSEVEKVNVMESGVLGNWEVRHREDLQKLLKLVEMIKEHLMASPIKRQAIVLRRGRSKDEQPVVEFYSVMDSYGLGLPHDLRAKWA
jgi:hypothetical protein